MKVKHAEKETRRGGVPLIDRGTPRAGKLGSAGAASKEGEAAGTVGTDDEFAEAARLVDQLIEEDRQNHLQRGLRGDDDALTEEQLEALYGSPTRAVPLIPLPKELHPGMKPLPTAWMDDDAAHGEEDLTDGDIVFPLEEPGQGERTFSLAVSVIGTPNAGKSQLVNALVKDKVSAVSPKRNTTRQEVLGVVTDGDTQIMIFDTPGVNDLRTAKLYQRQLATAAWGTAGSSDIGLVIIDAAKRLGGAEIELLEACKKLQETNKVIDLILVLNKVDLVEPKQKLLTLTERLIGIVPFKDVFMISSLTGDGVSDLEDYLYKNALPREWEFSVDDVTNVSDQERATEIIREKIFNRLNKEIPYRLEQETTGWLTLQDGSLRIEQKLIVPTVSQKVIVIGRHGNTLKSIGMAASSDLEAIFNRKVHIYLIVDAKDARAG